MEIVKPFDYNQLDTEARLTLKRYADEIKEQHGTVMRTAMGIGERLAKVRDLLAYQDGGFSSWVEAELDWSRQYAYSFINVWEQFKSVKSFDKLPIGRTARLELAKPSAPDEARQEALERAEQGEKITHKAAKEIVAKHKPKSHATPQQLEQFILNLPGLQGDTEKLRSFVRLASDGTTAYIDTLLRQLGDEGLKASKEDVIKACKNIAVLGAPRTAVPLLPVQREVLYSEIGPTVEELNRAFIGQRQEGIDAVVISGHLYATNGASSSDRRPESWLMVRLYPLADWPYDREPLPVDEHHERERGENSPTAGRPTRELPRYGLSLAVKGHGVCVVGPRADAINVKFDKYKKAGQTPEPILGAPRTRPWGPQPRTENPQPEPQLLEGAPGEQLEQDDARGEMEHQELSDLLEELDELKAQNAKLLKLVKQLEDEARDLASAKFNVQRDLKALKEQGAPALGVTPLTFPTFTVNPQLDTVTPGPKDPEHHKIKRLTMYLGKLRGALNDLAVFEPDELLTLVYSPGSRWIGLQKGFEEPMLRFKELEAALGRYKVAGSEDRAA